MKRIVSLIMMIVMLFALGLVPATVFADGQTDYIWIEAEDIADLEGDYVPVDMAPASGGKILTLYSTEEKDNIVNAKFNIETKTEYDIWVLSTLGNVSYLSTVAWALDGGEYTSFASPQVGAAYTTTDGHPTAMHWHCLTTAELDAGQHTLTILTNKLRTMANDYLLQKLDAFAIVPSSNNWMPMEGIVSRPFDLATMKVNPVPPEEILTGTLSVGQTMQFEVTHEVLEESDAEPVFYIRLMYQGDLVVSTNFTPSTPYSRWRVGQKYTDTVSLTIPAMLPDGNYVVEQGILTGSYADGTQTVKLAEYKYGNLKEVLKKTVTGSITLPSEIAVGEEVEGNAAFECENCDGKNVNAYVGLWQDDVLWYVDEVGKVPATGKFTFTVSDAIPAGTYTAKIGLHGIWSESGGTPVTVTSPEPDRYYKPMSCGQFYASGTGNSHFWYVTQNGVMIRDGEPYVPVGAMYNSNLITSYTPNDTAGNMSRFQDDINTLTTAYESGVNEIYINTVGNALEKPAWAWQLLIDLMEELGFKYSLQINGAFDYDIEAYEVHAYEAQMSVPGVTESGTVEYETTLLVYNAASCVYVAVNDETGEIVDSGTGTVTRTLEGKDVLSADVHVSGGSNTVYFTPKTDSARGMLTPQWGESKERLLQALEEFAPKLRLGDNMRSYIDIVTNEEGYYNTAECLFYAEPEALELNEEWLGEKYASIDKLNESWRITPALKNFHEATALVPVFTGAKGTAAENKGYLMNFETGDIYIADVRNGIMWDDYIGFKTNLFTDFNNDCAEAIKAGADAPAIYKQAGIVTEGWITDELNYGFDGLGGEVYGNLDAIKSRMGFANALVQQGSKTLWLLVTETNVDENTVAKFTSGEFSYPSQEYMNQHFDTLIHMGAKGIFDFMLHGWHDPNLAAYSLIVSPHVMQWHKEYREKLQSQSSVENLMSTKAYYAPSYSYPATRNWWYFPDLRQAAIYGDDYKLYIAMFEDYNNRNVLQTFDPSVETNLLYVTLEDAPATTVYGPRLLEFLQDKPEGEQIVLLGFRKNLGALPGIDEYYTDQYVTLENGEIVQILNPPEGARIIHETPDGKPWCMQVGDYYFLANDSWDMSTDPSQSLTDSESTIKYWGDLGLELGTVEVTRPGAATVINVDFRDIRGHWAERDIKNLASQGIVQGDGEGNFRPEGQVTRAEFLAMILRGLKISTHAFTGNYEDVSADDWYAEIAQTAYDMGLVDGAMLWGNNLSPNSALTRQEMAAIAACVHQKATGEESASGTSSYTDSGVISSWAQGYVEYASEHDLLKGMPDGSFMPNNSMTRAEAAVIVNRLLSTILNQE